MRTKYFVVALLICMLNFITTVNVGSKFTCKNLQVGGKRKRVLFLNLAAYIFS